LLRHHRPLRPPGGGGLRRPPQAARRDEPHPVAPPGRVDRDVPLPRALEAALRLGRRGGRVRGGGPVSEGAMPADVRLEEVVKEFGETRAVDGISLEIPRGSFFALLGPSGCGKTTTLRMIGGFEDATSGRIFLGDRDVVGLPPYKRDVNTVFQSYALFPHMTVTQNVAFGLERRKIGKTEVRARVREVFELVDLT